MNASELAGTAVAAGTWPGPLLLLAGALLLAGSSATGRLGALTTAAALPPGAPPVLRPAWIAVAAGAFAAIGWIATGGVLGAVIAAFAAASAGWAVRRATVPGDQTTDHATLAATWELLAVCLQAGLPVAMAAAAAATPQAGDTGRHLRRVAGLLELGADPGTAWRGVEHLPALATFARAAGRSAGTGAALAQVARAESARLRAGLVDMAEARAQRAAVLIAGPLGLCFLPAFLVLGIAPVVIGLAGEALARW
ncbi:MAG: type II secretion system F family protein [Pseudonocardia sp.]